MIRSFKCKRTEALYRGESVPEFQSIRAVALHKLDMLAAATRLSELRAPPGNRLEALKGGRRGQHSIRISPSEGGDQWRICFVWKDGAEMVEIVDYH